MVFRWRYGSSVVSRPLQWVSVVKRCCRVRGAVYRFIEEVHGLGVEEGVSPMVFSCMGCRPGLPGSFVVQEKQERKSSRRREAA